MGEPLTIEALRELIPEVARDIKLNLQSVLQPAALSAEQIWGVAVATAATAGEPRLYQALRAEALARVGAAVVEDAQAAAAIMGMNNVYYRFRHVVGKPSYGDKPARLRMNRLVKPATNRVDFELVCLAVSAVTGCEACVKAHEKTVIDGGLSEDQVHDAVRVAAVVKAAAIALVS